MSSSDQPGTERQVAQPLKVFRCLPNCGKCCSRLRNQHLEESAIEYGRNRTRLARKGLYLLAEASEVTILLEEWEVGWMRDRAAKIGVEFLPTPHMVVIDSLCDDMIVLSWNLGHATCPFLQADLHCGIYDLRPLLCRSFPLDATLQGDALSVVYLGRDLCPAFIERKSEPGKRYSAKLLREVYGYCAYAARDAAFVKEASIRACEDMVRRGFIFPTQGLDLDLLRNKCATARIRGLWSSMVDLGLAPVDLFLRLEKAYSQHSSVTEELGSALQETESS
jgi:Fe-S-cluster containining protein